MATIKNDRDISLQATSPRLIGTSLSISSDQGSFTKVKNGGISPTSILLTAIPSGLTAPTYQWYYASSNTPSSWTAISGATSITYSITSSLYTTHRSTGSSVTYKCTATQAGWTSADYTTTILYVAQADDIPLVLLSKEAISVPSNSTGTSMTYTGSSCTIRASLSGIFLPYSASGPASFSVSVSATNIASGAQTVSTTTVADDTLNFGVLSSMASGTSIVANITYTITVRDGNNTAFTFTKVQTITKAPTGNTGDTGVPGAPGAPGTPGAPGDPGAAGDRAVFAYRILSSSSLPSAPSIVQSTVPNSGTAVVSTTWYLQPKSTALSSNEWMFQVSGTVSVLGDYTWQTQGYLSTFKVGALSAISAELGEVSAGVGDTPGGKSLEVRYDTGTAWQFFADFIQGKLLWISDHIYISKNSAEQEAHPSPALRVKYSGNNTTPIDAVEIEKGSNVSANCPGNGLFVDFYGGNAYSGIYCVGDGNLSKVGNAIIGTTNGTGKGIYGITNLSGYGVFGQSNSSGQAVRGESTLYTEVSNSHAVVGVKWTNAGKTTWKGGIIGPADVNANFLADGSGATDYATFTGGHDVLLLPTDSIKIGDILVDTDIAGKSTPSNTISIGAVSTIPNQKSAVGVYVGDSATLLEYKPSGLREVSEEDYAILAATYKCSIMNSLGEGQVNVCGENGNLEPGDLITSSSIPGKGMKQSDDIIRNYTVAKCREHVTFDSPTQVKMVACIYLCG